MDQLFWVVAGNRMEQRLQSEMAECPLLASEVQCALGLCILFEDGFMESVAREFMVSPLWKDMIIKILDRTTKKRVCDENILLLFKVLAEWPDEKRKNLDILYVHLGGVDGHTYSPKQVGEIFGITEALAWDLICSTLSKIREELNPSLKSKKKSFLA